MDRYWLKHYPANVPHNVNPAEFSSLRDLIEQGCARHAAKPAYTSMGRTLTFAQLEARSRAFGAWLQREAGLGKGDRIALMMPNVLQYPIALFGALRAG
ncbi:MAG: AMP-binding protein, partial [Gammaproteobacteria bacterium]